MRNSEMTDDGEIFHLPRVARRQMFIILPRAPFRRKMFLTMYEKNFTQVFGLKLRRILISCFHL